MRRVCCAACKSPEGVIVTGPRHWHPLMRKAASALHEVWHGPDSPRFAVWEQGFIDFQGEFMDRREAWKVAEAAGQIVRRCGGDDANGGTLYSENLG